METCKELKCVCFECQTQKKDRPKCGMCPGRIAKTDCTGRTVWHAGFMPHAQLFQPPDHWIEYSKEWRDLNRAWSRPAIMKAKHRTGHAAPGAANLI